MVTKRFCYVYVMAFALAAASSGCIFFKKKSNAELRKAEPIPEPEQLDAARDVLAILAGSEDMEGRCSDCHDVKTSMGQWHQTGLATHDACFAEEGWTAKQKLECIQGRAPIDGDTSEGLNNLGFYSTLLGTWKFRELWKAAHEGDEASLNSEEFKKYTKKYTMPKPPSSYPLDDYEFELVERWFLNNMPKMTEAFTERENAPTLPDSTCTDETSPEMAAHVTAMNADGWHVRNLNANISMFGCKPMAPGAAYDFLKTPLTCFTQKKAGKDVFPIPEELSLAWTPKASAEGTLPGTLRVLRTMKHETSFWMRSSADGRYVANGGESSIDDLESTFDPTLKEYLTIDASYDPGFYPNNEGFTFHGTEGGAVLCDQKLLQEPTIVATGKIQLNNVTTEVAGSAEKKYCAFHEADSYQHVGASLGGQTYYMVEGSHAADEGGAGSRDPGATSFAYSTTYVNIHPFKAKRETSGDTIYTYDSPLKVKVPFEGDWYISPSSQLLVSKMAGKNTASGKVDQAGYRVRKLKVQGTLAEASPIARACLRGGKPTVSFNERLLAVHHYVEENDWKDMGFSSSEDPEFKKLLEKGSSNIYIYDLVTKKKGRITQMGPGVNAVFPHFRSDGWIYFLVRDDYNSKSYIAASDAAILLQAGN